jgi:hypothetical protein
MEVIDSFYPAYGETPVMYQDSIMVLGNDFLDQRYPQLDTITGTPVADSGR